MVHLHVDYIERIMSFVVVAGVRALRQIWRRLYKVDAKTQQCTPVFGTDLVEQVQATASLGTIVLLDTSSAKGTDQAFSSVPELVRTCVNFIDEHAVINGIYRSPGIKSNVEMLR